MNIQDIIRLQPCDDYTKYYNALLRELFGDREEVTLLEALRDDRVPSLDRIWIGCHAASPRTEILFATRCATRALISEQKRTGQLVHEDLWRAVAVAIWYADGLVSDGVLFAAGDAAWSAALSARDAAGYAAGYAAGDAERDWQLATLIEMIERET